MGSVAELLADPRLRHDRPLPMQIKRSAVLSACGTYRWSLSRWWGPGPILPWIMLNPSTADADIDDPTLHRIIGFSWRWGFDGLLVFNVFPFRSPKPAALQDWLRWGERQDWHARDVTLENWQYAAGHLATYDAAIAAWGAQPGRLGQEAELGAESLVDAINDPEQVRPPATRMRVLELFCLGETVGRSPKHPMARGVHRVPDDAQPRPISRYPGTMTAAPFEARA